LAATLDFPSFFTMAFLVAAHFLNSLAVFALYKAIMAFVAWSKHNNGTSIPNTNGQWQKGTSAI